MGRKKYSGLSEIKTIDDAYRKFDLSPRDRIDRREQIKIYRRIEKCFEDDIIQLTTFPDPPLTSDIENRIYPKGEYKRYDVALNRKTTLDSLLKEFKQRQKDEEELDFNKQRKLFIKAEKRCKSKLKDTIQKHYEEAALVCDKKKKFRDKKQKYQIENIDKNIKFTPVPRMKYSPYLMGLRQAEKRLASLHQYNEAKDVRSMLERLQPVEDRAFVSNFNKAMNHKKSELLRKHKEEDKFLNESLRGLHYGVKHRANKSAAVHKQMMKNLKNDMEHMHTLDGAKISEMAIKKSWRLQKRKNYEETGAGYRGQQFLDSVNGKAKDVKIFVATLSDIHNFRGPLMKGTVKLPIIHDHCTSNGSF